MKLRAEATGREEHDGALVGGKYGGAGATRHGFDVDVIAVVVVEDEHVGVACAGRANKAAGLVGVDLASDVLAGGV